MLHIVQGTKLECFLPGIYNTILNKKEACLLNKKKKYGLGLGLGEMPHRAQR